MAQWAKTGKEKWGERKEQVLATTAWWRRDAEGVAVDARRRHGERERERICIDHVKYGLRWFGLKWVSRLEARKAVSRSGDAIQSAMFLAGIW
ncbi:hypothetical protein E2542_SST11754 [Spatholobus suberectus]|nr:hypothetical protein E2542_SST11754 [Spatholobus suberectus]